MKSRQRKVHLCSDSPGESSPQPKVSEKGNLLESLPEGTLSVPLRQADVAPITSFRHTDDSVGREDVVLTASFVGVDHSQVVGPEEKP